jgi:23S rRNA (adenine2503-C2)-methyltransferase
LRHTVCLSTQVGCPLRCSFCYSGTVPFSRNLSAAEVIGQFLSVTQDLDPQPSRVNVVFMGMGEPLLNLQTVLRSLDILTDPDAFAVSPRRITVSTAGLARELDEFARKAPPVGLAVSLHGTTNEIRGGLMPINRKYRLEELLETVRGLPLPRRRKITFEYVLLGGENDGEEDARRLARLLKGIKSKVNLIPHNPWPGSPHRPSSPEATERFFRILVGKGYTVSLRRSRGDDILAACGQLAGGIGQVATLP